MAELKTKPSDSSVEEFLNSIEDETKRQDSFVVLDLMKQVTGADPVMWGSSIIGFGGIHYQYASGRTGDWFQVGFSPRKQNLTLYLTYDITGQADLLNRLGKFKTGKSCLYIKKLADIDLPTLKKLVERSVPQ